MIERLELDEVRGGGESLFVTGERNPDEVCGAIDDRNDMARDNDKAGARTSVETARYFERFGFCGRQIRVRPRDDLAVIVVIPCFDEPNLIGSLRSLWGCERPSAAVEVIVVFNSAEGSPAAVLRRNEEARARAEMWVREHDDERFRFYFLDFPDLPAKRAGVGLARKIGMDEALRRFDDVGRPDGVILCFDADCGCDGNYLPSVEGYFSEHPAAPGASIYFEHPLSGPEPAAIYEGIARYELHLRYYVEGLRWAGFPHAYHTIGSSMAVRARFYREQGGMNKRQAGEDFYFLHKIIPLGNFGEINGTRVIASPRPSHRVPFGTGRAVQEFLATGRIETYPLRAFEDLRELFAAVPGFYEEGDAMDGLPEVTREFLGLQGFGTRLEEMRGNTRSAGAFRKRFFRWFDGFLAMKYIHFARDRGYGVGELLGSAREMYRRRVGDVPESDEVGEILGCYRRWQRSGNGLRAE